MAEAIFFLETLHSASHPARSTLPEHSNVPRRSTRSARSTTRAPPELATFFGCQRVNPSTLAAIKAVIGMHLTPPGYWNAKLGVSRRTFMHWKATLYGEKSKQ